MNNRKEIRVMFQAHFSGSLLSHPSSQKQVYNGNTTDMGTVCGMMAALIDMR